MNYYILIAGVVLLLNFFIQPDTLVVSQVVSIFVIIGLVILSYLHRILIELKKERK